MAVKKKATTTSQPEKKEGTFGSNWVLYDTQIHSTWEIKTYILELPYDNFLFRIDHENEHGIIHTTLSNAVSLPEFNM